MQSLDNMGPGKLSSPLHSSWKEDLRTAIRTADELYQLGLIEATAVDPLQSVIAKYQFVLPRYYANLINKSDPLCPIRLQAIPDLRELHEQDSLSSDPLMDFKFQPAPRITHRYPNRLLLHLTPNCSMYCRYCFRKSILNTDRMDFFEGRYQEGLRYIESNAKIEEVIFSGGDPLLVDNSIWAELIERLNGIAHLKRIRTHTRTVVTLPNRIDSELVAILQKSKLPLIWVNHFNHPREFTVEAKLACDRLKSTGATLLNQSVLLPGVNADSDILKELCERVFEFGMLPYYLHHPDPAQGTAHFQLNIEQGLNIYRTLQSLLPGYLVPRYVQDDPNLPFKRNVELFASLP